MPEGPEVRRTVDALAATFLNKEVSRLDFLSGRYKKKDFRGYLDFCEEVPRLVTAVSCKGKFIYFLFADGSSLWNTLGMSGYWSHKKGRHARAVMTLKTGESMFYNDMRNFGTFRFSNDQEELEKKLSTLGPDLLSEEVNVENFISRFLSGKRKTKPIAQNLMDQSVVSGIGNYLKAEILYATRMSPHRLCENISEREYVSLLNASRDIMRLSYESGGATIRNYRGANGENGVYTRRFAVYNQGSDPLGNEVVKEKTADKRTTHWVPKLQN